MRAAAFIAILTRAATFLGSTGSAPTWANALTKEISSPSTEGAAKVKPRYEMLIGERRAITDESK